ncbi:nuclear protein localization protein 4 [Kappamyces sp. JEL0680]|nr:nuclear protein localization protein 4 [Kappamyces sp. JEL0680]
MTLILRLRAPNGQYRIETTPSESISSLREKISKAVGTDVVRLATDQHGNGTSYSLTDPSGTVGAWKGVTNGMMLWVASNDKGKQVHEAVPQPKPLAVKPSFIKQDPLDEYLLKQPGTIKRPRNPQFCKHGDQGMCEYCLPLQPYDAGYLEENRIKHMAFHAYLRQIVETNKVPSPFSPQFLAPLDVSDYSVLKPCPSGTHPPYPAGICSKCQPSAITLQTQNFRMVDHVEFESPALIEHFLSYWRATGTQRAGYLYGKYEPYDKVPLGVKAVVQVIYEMPQEDGHDYIQIGKEDPLQSQVDTLALALGLTKLGVLYTDLTDDGSGKGTVICKRHGNSYFLSSAEILYSAHMQSLYPVKTVYSSSGEFGSRFMTVVITGNEEGGIDFQSYQVSNSAMAMAKNGIIEASTDPALMRVAPPSAVKYVPDVFFKYKNHYNIMVQEAAKPTFPVEYLLITSSHGFPSNPAPAYNLSNTSYTENRMGMLGDRSMARLKQDLASATSFLSLISNFHLLLFLLESGLLDNDTMGVLCRAVVERNESLALAAQQTGAWQTLAAVLAETDIPRANGGRGAGAGGSGHSSDPWSCPHCTFTNISGGSECEMCGLPKE